MNEKGPRMPDDWPSALMKFITAFILLMLEFVFKSTRLTCDEIVSLQNLLINSDLKARAKKPSIP